MVQNRVFTLAARPAGMPKESDFQVITTDVPSVGEGEVLVKSLYISVDPYMRGRMKEFKEGSYFISAFEVGKALDNFLVGKVEESKNEKYKAGDLVSGVLPFQDYNLIPADKVNTAIWPVPPAVAEGKIPLSTVVGILGMPGLTSYHGLLEIGQPKEGETVLVSGAAGAVGMAVGQIAKIKGCYVVGIAGSSEKCQYLKDELGFDEVINYKEAGNLTEAVAKACPKGVDVYFDNVGGEALDAALLNMNRFARIPVCGAISQYNEEEVSMGPRLSFTLVVKQARMEGFLVNQFADKNPQAIADLSQWILEGKLKYKETVLHGMDKIGEAFIGLFTGANTGKMVIQVNDE